ncbi:MAG: penicillin-binding protein 1A [Mariprofundaceae bacterium]
MTAVTIGYLYFSDKLPELSTLSEYQPPLATRVFNTRGELVAEYADEHRILTPLEEIPARVRNAFLAAEDQQFYQHPGINPARIVSAAIANLRAGRTIQGGSTITQQVAKNFLLSPERTYTRKIREIILAYRIEKAFSKDDILYLYLNHIYLGRGAYGVASAAWRYFGKRLDELTLAEAAMLAGLPKAPGKYAPHLNPDNALKRRNTVLYLMQQSSFASPGDVAEAIKAPLQVAPLPRSSLTNTYENSVQQLLIQQFGAQTLRRQGLTIIIPYDPRAEEAAIHAVRKGLLEIEQRQLYRFPTHHAPEQWEELLETWANQRQDQPAPLATDELMPALVEEVMSDGRLKVNDGIRQWILTKPKWKWEDYPEPEPAPEPDLAPEPAAGEEDAGEETGSTPVPEQKKRPPTRTWIAGDEIVLQGTKDGGVRLTQRPSIEAALYSIDLKHGTVLAQVGGFDYKLGDFDRVGHAMRQPGSAFKPFLYATAMESGFTPASIVMDSPVVFENQQIDEYWRPENYRNRFVGQVTLRDALEHSRNLASIKLLQNIGIGRFLRSLRNYPLQRDFPPQLALALGATEVTPEALTESYIVFASSGQKWKPVSVLQVQDRTGKSLHRSVAGNRCQVCHADPVLPVGDNMTPAEQVIDPVSNFLVTNMMKGVIERGTGRRARALNRPAAGKTGTTNKQVDAWFMGYTPQILTGVWVGRDTPVSMGRHETGSRAALPIWLEAMQSFHRGKPVEDFIPPEDTEWVAIDPKTGKLAGEDTELPFLEAFRVGTAPVEEERKQETDNQPEHKKKNFFDLGL